jgi:hypothetical protein
MWFRCSSRLRALALASLLMACGNADLPPGWGGAERIDDFTQVPCGGSAIDGPAESVTAQGKGERIALEYMHAPFRCQQDVEAYVRESGSAVDVLVQPVELDVTVPVRCDCLYNLSMGVDASAGSHKVTVYRRGDNFSLPNDPVQVGSVPVQVP